MYSESAENTFFIVSSARSGSTSLTRILDSATNGRCVGATETLSNTDQSGTTCASFRSESRQ